MALPGLGEDDLPALQEQQEPVEHELAANQEWRFEVAWTETVEVKLVSGTAELFGTELGPQHTYVFRGTKAAIFTHHGCTISSLGVLQSDYVSEETPMTQYVNLHFALEEMREAARDGSGGNSNGPRVLVLGPPNAGKTSLCKLLAAYALRSGATPGILVANIDPHEGLLSLPGTLGTVLVDSILDVEAAPGGWGSAPISGPMAVPVKLPLAYYFGREELEHDEAGYRALVGRLALAVQGRMASESSNGSNSEGGSNGTSGSNLRANGLIVDAPGNFGAASNGSGPLLEHVVSEFGIDVVVVVGSEKMYSDVSRRLATAGRPGAPTVLKLDRSGGAVYRDPAYLARARREDVHAYFYGDARAALNPHAIFVDWAEIAVFRLTGQQQGQHEVPDAFLPGGAADGAASSPLAPLQRVDELEPELHNAILAVVDAEPGAPLPDIRRAAVLGYVHVAEIDDKRRRLKVLAPLSGRLPRRTLIWGAWPEQVELDAAAMVAR